ncbi:MAG: acetyl-CoA carboxylase biotin carboxylase subunit [Chlamydiota bacterium]|nr:acetyl-CoA carboxylase biotin carboxylase subunit [Chlamydiota bacterium]
MFQKVLIANRGEIAVRIIRACNDLGLQTVAIYSTADRNSLHVLHANEAVCVGPPRSADSYLKVPHILSACQVTGAEAVHPGYGFLSEDHHFARMCEENGLHFIGPSSDTIQQLGGKVAAKALAKQVGCPTIPGSEGFVTTEKEAFSEAKKIGYPLMIKASAGGGGKGIRIVESERELASHFHGVRHEAENLFGDSGVYMEKQILMPRHVEVQVLADKQGKTLHLGERDCTIQRRRQKLIEESPSPILTSEVREKMGKAAVDLVAAAGYYSAGTVEFLVDSDNHFYFMEVNTRIQVEHTVTEERTGIDLVREQIRIARGEPLGYSQQSIQSQGHVFQFRINAEDPSNQFLPSPGPLDYYTPSGGPHVRVDSACYHGYVVPPYYDSLIAKLIVKGKDREEAIYIARRALREFHIGGVTSTIPFHEHILEHPQFISSEYDLDFIDKMGLQECVFKAR